MSFSLHPLSAADMPATASVRLAAFSGSPAQTALRPQGSTSETYLFYERKHLHEFQSNPHTYFIGIREDHTGELVAYGQWQRDLASDRAIPTPQKEGPKYSPGSNYEAQDVFFTLLEQSENEAMAEVEDYWHLHLLATRPEYQGRGLARMIMQWGKDRAREDSLPAYLDATESGKPLYDRVGFVAGKEWNMDLAPFGVGHWNRQWPMRWEPKQGV